MLAKLDELMFFEKMLRFVRGWFNAVDRP